MRRRLSLILLVVALLALPRTAAAHEGAPGLVYAVDAIRPALPGAVVVQVQSGLAEQLVAANPTDTPLEVLSDQGEPFLRISRAGVFGNVASADWWASNSPTGVLDTPDPVRGDPHPATPRWTRIGSGSSWGWFDHRLPPAGAVPAEVVARAQPATLQAWSVPVRYGGRPHQIEGNLSYSPILGSFLVAADPAPAGVVATALPGPLPGLFLQVPPGLRLTVLGRDGEPFARFTGDAVQLNQRSRTYVEDRAARNLAAGAPGDPPQWAAPTSGSTLTWLDQRLQFPTDLPPERFVHAAAPVVVGDWSIPLLLATGKQQLRGTISWQPVPGTAAAQAAATSPRARTRWPYALLALLVAPAGWLLARRRRSRTRPPNPVN